jgi:hypothetical protein
MGRVVNRVQEIPETVIPDATKRYEDVFTALI